MIKEAIHSFPDVKEAIVFGSRAMGNFKKGSDIDIALKGNLKDNTLIKLQVILDEELPIPYYFDLVDYQHIENQALKLHIDVEGKPLGQKSKFNH